MRLRFLLGLQSLVLIILTAVIQSQEVKNDDAALAGMQALLLLYMVSFADRVIDAGRAEGCETLECCNAKLEAKTREQSLLMGVIEERWKLRGFSV